MVEWKIVLNIILQSKAIIVYSIITVYTFCKPLHIRILRNGNIPKPSCWPQDNHKCLVIFVLLIWHGWMVEKAAAQRRHAVLIYIESRRGEETVWYFFQKSIIMFSTASILFHCVDFVRGRVFVVKNTLYHTIRNLAPPLLRPKQTNIHLNIYTAISKE